MDIEVFSEAKKVIDALQNKEVTPALAWCADNKSRLKKSKVYSSFVYTPFFLIEVMPSLPYITGTGYFI